MSKRPRVIAGVDFDMMKTLVTYIRGILCNATREKPLTGFEAKLAADLFERHPEYAARTAFRRVKHFTVSTAKGGTRCFYAVYADGSMQDFSFKKCL